MRGRVGGRESEGKGYLREEESKTEAQREAERVGGTKFNSRQARGLGIATLCLAYIFLLLTLFCCNLREIPQVIRSPVFLVSKDDWFERGRGREETR